MTRPKKTKIQRKKDYSKLTKSNRSANFLQGSFLLRLNLFKKKTKKQSNIEFKLKKEITKRKKRSLLGGLLSLLGYIFITPFLLIITPFKLMGKTTIGVLSSRQNYVKIAFIVVFCGIIFRFAQLQIVGVESRFALLNSDERVSKGEIVLARRGQIYIQDLSQNKLNVPITSSELQTSVFIDAKNLQDLVTKGLDIESAVMEISSRVNLSFSETLDLIKNELNKVIPSSHVIISKNISESQRESIIFLRSSDLNKIYNFQSWLGLSVKQTRSYPQNKLLSATIGYVPPHMESESEIKRRIPTCLDMVEQNNIRGTGSLEYMVGFYGLEQKYCSELGGLNGLRKFGYDTGTEEKEVQNGADLYLTIDRNIQQQAEQILEQAVRDTTNSVGSPKNGTIIVMESKTGKVRAMASYPSYDPNNYQQYFQENPAAFRNTATNIDYDIGSVMKPLTVAAALDIYTNGFTENGVRKGVPLDYGFIDYNSKGKPYQELDGNTYYINNAEGFSYQTLGTLGLKEIIRDSINTGVADIVDETGARKLKEYFEERFKFGQPTAISLPGDEHGNITNFQKDINCPFCYANFGFGQGFTASPIQLVRAFSAIANQGYLVEPYIVDKIQYKNGDIDDGSSIDSRIPKERQQQVLTPQTARLVTSYMQAVIEEGYVGLEQSPAKVNGYQVAGKTGTAEVNRPYINTDSQGNPVFDEDGKPVLVPCNYECNRARGIYDHSFIGFGPVKDPRYIVLVKLSEPNPGEIKNFSSGTVARPFSQMMEFTLDYAGVPRDY